VSDLVVCPECKAEAPLVTFCETCGYTHEPTFPSLIERVEHYLTENGWVFFHDLGANKWWKRPDVTEGLTLGEAFDVQLARAKEGKA